MIEQRLCALSDIEDGGSAAFTITFEDRPLELMAIRREVGVVYINSCLGFAPGSVPRPFPQSRASAHPCSTHGAQFRIEDGYCIKSRVSVHH